MGSYLVRDTPLLSLSELKPGVKILVDMATALVNMKVNQLSFDVINAVKSQILRFQI